MRWKRPIPTHCKTCSRTLTSTAKWAAARSATTLVEFIKHFDQIPPDNASFEFPDLLGSAYEYLIKYFADSAGKKGGEFYTPAEVVRLLVLIIDPKPGMALLDPTAGSGGMLIQSHQYVQETGGNAQDLLLMGQEDNGGTWAICQMNMILHGIHSEDIARVIPWPIPSISPPTENCAGLTVSSPIHLSARTTAARV